MATAERLRTASSAAAATAEETELGSIAAIVGGGHVETGDTYAVRSPYDDAPIALIHRAGPDEIEASIAAAAAAFETTKRLASHERASVLERVSRLIAERRDELARTIALEAGKPLKTAKVEVDRASFTFKVAAEESKRIYGEIVPLDWIPGTEGRVAHVRRIPLGPIAGISPFNFPLNLVAHKVAPALAAGNPIVVRPASQTPVSALRLGELVLEAGWPEGGISVVPSSTDAAAPLVEDERIKLLTFTGSPAVGWSLKERAGRKRVTLELGGNAPVIVHADADPPFAAERIAWGGSVAGGAKVLTGGARNGRMWQPTVMTEAKEEMRISCEEAFAPLVVVYRFDDVDEAIERASATKFGLQAGLFTRDLGVVEKAFERIETGGLMVNDVSTFRVDHMPYGGVKHSGSGREGLRYAIEEMTELKLLTINTAPL